MNTPASKDIREILSQANEWEDYFRIIKKYRNVIFFFTLLSIVFSTLFILGVPDLYKSNVKILIDRVDKSKEQRINPDIITSTLAGEDDYYGTQTMILMSDKLIDLTANQLELGKKVQFDTTESNRLSRYLHISYDPSPEYKVEARRLRLSQVIQLSVEGTDPKLTQKIANQLSRNYVEENAKENIHISQQMFKWLSENETKTENAQVESLISINSDPVLLKLREDKTKIEFKIRENIDHYKPGHPLMKELATSLSNIDSQIDDRKQTIIGNLKSALDGEMAITNVRILEAAGDVGKYAGPNRLLWVIVSGIFGFILGLICVVIMDAVNPVIREEDDVEFLKIPVLGKIPSLNGTSNVLEKWSQEMPLQDAMSNVRVHLLLSMPYEKSKKIMCVGNIASLLGISLAAAGRKIVLIDANLRNPSLHSALGMPNSAGLTEFLVGGSDNDKIVQSVGQNLYLISAGSGTPNPVQLLASDRFKELLDKLTEQFDRVIVDVPDSLEYPDALIVAKHMHCSVLVGQAYKTSKFDLKKVRDNLYSVNQPIAGIIFQQSTKNTSTPKIKLKKSL